MVTSGRRTSLLWTGRRATRHTRGDENGGEQGQGAGGVAPRETLPARRCDAELVDVKGPAQELRPTPERKTDPRDLSPARLFHRGSSVALGPLTGIVKFTGDSSEAAPRWHPCPGGLRNGEARGRGATTRPDGPHPLQAATSPLALPRRWGCPAIPRRIHTG